MSSAIEQRAVQQELGEIVVRASVPSDEEAAQLFGIPIHKHHIQAVWLEIRNNSAERARFAPYSVDRDYFPPYEVAYMNRRGFSAEALQQLEIRLHSMSLRRTVDPGETIRGYVFTNATEGTKAFNVDVFYTGDRARNEHFTFFIDVPGFVPDHATVDFRELYSEEEVVELTRESLHERLPHWDCCTTGSDLDSLGQPVTVFLVARSRDLLQALLRAGWSENSSDKTDNYLNISDYYFARTPDAIFRKGRDNSTERIEMSLWLSPVRVDGVPVWAAQLKHAIGRQFEIGEYFLGTRLDPDANEGRNYLLQDLWYSRSLLAYAWSESGVQVSEDNPRIDFNKNVWFSDGFRVVMWLSGAPVSLESTQDLNWDRIARSGEAEQ